MGLYTTKNLCLAMLLSVKLSFTGFLFNGLPFTLIVSGAVIPVLCNWLTHGGLGLEPITGWRIFFGSGKFFGANLGGNL